MHHHIPPGASKSHFSPMNSVTVSMIVVPGVVALLLFLVFTYLYEQSRQLYFRAWQIGWAAYTLHYAFDAWSVRRPSAMVTFLGSLLLVTMALCLFVSTRLIRDQFRVRWYDIALASGGVALALWNIRLHILSGSLLPEIVPDPHFRLEIFVAAVLFYCSCYFYVHAHRKNSLAFKLLAFALAVWAALMWAGQFESPFMAMFGTAGHLLGPAPQMLLGIAMVMVLFESERNAVQENALAFSTLGVDPGHVLNAKDLVPSMSSSLERLVAPLPKRRAILYISQHWRTTLPSVQRGFSPDLLEKLQAQGAGEYISELSYRRGG